MSQFATSISNEELAGLPAAQFDGEIVVVDTEEALERAYAALSQERVLGFDTETRPSFTAGYVNKVALIQLSTLERCYLIRLCRMKKFPERVVQLLCDEKIMKIGVGVTGDVIGLNKIRKFRARGFFELQDYVKRFGIENFSLRKISAIVLGERVSKAQRLSNWEASSLTGQQKMYAATDAWVCLRIYNALRMAEQRSE